MATSIDFGFSSDQAEDVTEKNGAKKKLDFYQSMYHFKKMFPKFDSEVIETVLRSNHGSVEKTLDQLLTMSIDNENYASSSHITQSCLISSNVNPLSDSHDLPPSYHEIMSSSSTSSFNESPKSADLIDLNNDKTLFTSNQTASVEKNPKSLYKPSPSLIRNYDRILVGELSKDFLRIKLTKDQINCFKNSIKIAKRDEISALLNNKTPKYPELSFELRQNLNVLMNQLEESATDLEDWEAKYKSLLRSFENKRLQIIQDEYLAKLMQNEEFLNEIRTDQDFLNTLNDESDSKYEFDHDFSYRLKGQSYPNKTLSNAELIAKLSNMGKQSRAKLNKLASKFMSRNKSPRDKIEFNSIDFSSFNDYSSTGSSLKGEVDFDENSTYDLERIRAEELGSGFNTLNKNNRYKKAYKSIKTAITRNNSSQKQPISDLEAYRPKDLKNKFY
ncbi:CUE domain-containing 1 [Brachionus plicatilis]|uniref:CUE domain-containing 1 n=1 Tax=Brachionus plicatilis TaxID=10195 RepID=A0A3M7SXD1_BRAPC|nr:CUE domain-containing 1 [Brachionus plicatilis]